MSKYSTPCRYAIDVGVPPAELYCRFCFIFHHRLVIYFQSNNSQPRVQVIWGQSPDYSKLFEEQLVSRLKESNVSKTNESRAQECSICLQAITQDNFIHSLPCSHCFHFSCIVRWLTQKSSCPLCRHPIT